ncbi:MAG: hypothetical protein H7222_07890 [Methylotenera sp.]|nr:hypothetical protein [Oligoflexia bacterium]
MKNRISVKTSENPRRHVKWLIVTAVATFGFSAHASADSDRASDLLPCNSGQRVLQNSALSKLSWSYQTSLLPIIKAAVLSDRSSPAASVPAASEMTLDSIRGSLQGVAPADLMISQGPILPQADDQRRPWQEGMYMENGMYLPGSSLDPKNGPAPNPQFQVSANFWSSPMFTAPAPQVWMSDFSGYPSAIL